MGVLGWYPLKGQDAALVNHDWTINEAGKRYDALNGGMDNKYLGYHKRRWNLRFQDFMVYTK